MSSNMEGKITKKDLRKVFWRSIPMEHSWNYERMMNIGYCFAMLPVLKKLYPNKKDYCDAMTRHLEFYNTTPYIITLPLGISAAMEEKRAEDPENFDTVSITTVKTALMGPLAGIGDSFYWGTLRIIATGIGTSLALQGNILGPILFLLVYNVPALLIRYFLTFVGYRLGVDVISKVNKSGIMDLVTEGAGIMGLMVAGAMTASMVYVSIPIAFGEGETATTVQAILDQIMPGLLPLLVTGLVYLLLKRKAKPLMIMLILFIVGIVGAYFGVLA